MVSDASLSAAAQSPLEDDRHFLQDRWESERDAGISPLTGSALAGDEADRLEFLTGARLLGLRKPGRTLKPQQLRSHDMLAAGHRDNSILMPRRSSKTTGLVIEGIGRAQSEEREDYRVGILTATTGKAGRSRFLKDVAPALERNTDGRLKIVRSAGQERVEWRDTGNSMAWLSTVDDARGEAFDLFIVDESGEPDPDKVDDIKGAVLPTLDTRPGAQFVVAGTAGDYRDGNLLWDGLAVGRGGIGGVIEYAVPDGLTVDDIASWTATEPLVRLSHPGVDTLTTIEAIRSNYEQLGRARFLREYLGIFGDAGGTTALIKPKQWEALALDGDYPKPPNHFGLAMAMTPNQSGASLVAAWRENGVARGLLLDQREGTVWLAKAAAALATKYRLPVVHDVFGPVLVTVEELNRMQPRPKLEPRTMKQVTTAAALLVREIETGNLGHWHQGPLDAAILGMVRRKIGLSGWGLGRPSQDADITAAEAFALALHWYDENPKRERIGIIAA